MSRLVATGNLLTMAAVGVAENNVFSQVDAAKKRPIAQRGGGCGVARDFRARWGAGGDAIMGRESDEKTMRE